MLGRFFYGEQVTSLIPESGYSAQNGWCGQKGAGQVLMPNLVDKNRLPSNPQDVWETLVRQVMATAFIRRKVALAGATGLIGGYLLDMLLAEDSVAEVHALVRRPLKVSHPRLHCHRVDFAALPELPPIDEAYLALGTTLKVAGSREAFRAVDLQANLAVAMAAVRAGARRIGLVSAAGANAQSSVFYNRVKGELEEALKSLELEALVIARPSLLLDSRAHLGQPPRLAESVAIPMARLIAPLIPGAYRPIHGKDVARALLRSVLTAKGAHVLTSGDMVGR